MTALRQLSDISCKNCGAIFRPRRAEQGYCSKECWYSNLRNKDKTCECCGGLFRAKYAQQKYCSVACKNKGISKDKTVFCAFCGSKFERPHGKTRAYCSIQCSNKARSAGMKKPKITLDARVISDKTISSSGYVMVREDGKKMLEHRLVMEQIIGRPLERHERVHHKNGDRKDNRPENLELWTGIEQSKKDQHGIRVVDKVIDMLSSLTKEEREKVRSAIDKLS